MNEKQIRWKESVRILWAITAKDLIEAIKNKNTAFLIVFGILMVVFYAQYPTLMTMDEPTIVLVHDEGQSALTAYLENSPALNVYTYPNAEVMQERLSNGDIPELGLVIPAGFDQAVESGQAPALRGYVVHWVTDKQAAELLTIVSEEASRLAGTAVSIELADSVVYPTTESGGLGVTAGIAFVYIITSLGLIMVPHLMLEEKQSHTLEALLVSPASHGHVAAAKALTGLFYGLVGAGIGLAVFHNLVVHWWLAVLTVICGVLFTSAMGLLLGSLIDNRGQLTLMAWIFIVPLFLPVFLSLMDDLLPAALIQVMRAIPTVIMFNLLRMSFLGSFPVGTALLGLAWIAACAGIGLAGVAWWIGRRDRAAAVFPPPAQPAITDRIANGARESLGSLGRALPRRESTRRAASRFTAPAGLRAILAIASKDIGMAFRSKLVLSILLGTALVVANGAILPALLGLRGKPTAIVYDEGRSTILRGLTAREDLRIGIVESQEEMEASVSGAPDTRLGLVLPSDFDQRAGGSQPVTLEGYLAHWANQERAEAWTAVFAEELSKASWSDVRINTTGNVLYPTAETGGQLWMNTMVLLIVILTIGMALVPLLFIEEKESRTFDVLLISPASLWQVVAGKALAGMFYCLSAALVVLLFNRYLMLHWGVALLAIALGAAFTVALGLIVGLLSETPATTGMWSGSLIVGLALLTGLNGLAGEDWPAAVRAVLERLPGSALFELFSLSMVGEIPLGLVWANAAALVAAAGLVYLVIYGLLRRADR